MRIMITETQLSKILRKKKQMKKDVEEANDITSTSSSTSSPSTTSPSSATSSSASPTSGEPGSSPSAEDYPPYPEVGKWESGVTRGPANQIAVTKWSDTVGSSLTRGKANPLK